MNMSTQTKLDVTYWSSVLAFFLIIGQGIWFASARVSDVSAQKAQIEELKNQIGELRGDMRSTSISISDIKANVEGINSALRYSPLWQESNKKTK